MTNSFKIKIKPQYVATTNTIYNGRNLHVIQKTMFHLSDQQEDVLILVAPPGTGKSYSFPLEVDYLKANKITRKRMLIVSPTNALIEDMYGQYTGEGNGKQKALFPDLEVATLNGKVLDRYGAKGKARWGEFLHVASRHDIVITNPDIINWAMTGGYVANDFKFKIDEVSTLFEEIDYFVFDEYHLYDEEQIAAINAWMLLAKAFLESNYIGCKFIFASATPQEKLPLVLRKQGFQVKVIAEEILGQPKTGAACRQIKGAVYLVFKTFEQGKIDTIDNALIRQLNDPKTQDELKRGFEKKHRALVILDEMMSIRQSLPQIKALYQGFNVEEISGYFTKADLRKSTTHNKNTIPALPDLILGTKKVEVGVNLGIKNQLMGTGKSFADFLQRLGRPGRQDKQHQPGIKEDASVLVYLTRDKFKKLKEGFSEHSDLIQELDYQHFVNICVQTDFMDEEKFYPNKVAPFVGTYFYIVERYALQYFSTKQQLGKHLADYFGEIYGKRAGTLYQAMRAVKTQIKYINQHYKQKQAKKIESINDWWQQFIRTFSFFRGSSISVKILDENLEQEDQMVEYSLEWLLKNRIVIDVKKNNQKEDIFVVAGFREVKAKLRYVIETFPFGDYVNHLRYLPQKHKYTPKKTFTSKINELKDVLQNGRSTSPFDEEVIKLLDLILKLKPIFSEKRFLISAIETEN